MRISAMSSDVAQSGVSMRVAEAMNALVGGTPLLTLRTSGHGRVHAKLEGMQAGGSWYDRVARRLLSRSPRGADLLVEDDGAWAVSVALLAASEGRSLEVLVERVAAARTAQLVKTYGARVRAVPAAERDAWIASRHAEGALLLRAQDPDAVDGALREIADEIDAQSSGLRSHALWVLSDVGCPAEHVAAALGVDPARLVVVPRIGVGGEDIPSEVATRRLWMGHREGVLVGPDGAAVVHEALLRAEEGTDEIVAILPDGGHRYLGWW